MNIIARAALYLYDGSNAAPIFPGKVGQARRRGRGLLVHRSG